MKNPARLAHHGAGAGPDFFNSSYSRAFHRFTETANRSISLFLRNSGRKTAHTFPGIALVAGAALDDDRAVMVPVGRARDDDSVFTAVMAMTPVALAVVIESHRAVMAVVETVALVIDDDRRAVMIMMPVMGADDDISLGRGSDCGCGDTERQGS